MSGLDLRVPFTVCQAAFGLPGTVTRPSPDDSPIETTVVWMPPVTQDAPGGGLAYQRRDPSLVLAVSKADVPTVPRGTVIVAADALGGDVQRWKVDALERSDTDHVRVMVLPAHV